MLYYLTKKYLLLTIIFLNSGLLYCSEKSAYDPATLLQIQTINKAFQGLEKAFPNLFDRSKPLLNQADAQILIDYVTALPIKAEVVEPIQGEPLKIYTTIKDLYSPMKQYIKDDFLWRVIALLKESLVGIEGGPLLMRDPSLIKPAFNALENFNSFVKTIKLNHQDKPALINALKSIAISSKVKLQDQPQGESLKIFTKIKNTYEKLKNTKIKGMLSRSENSGPAVADFFLEEATRSIE